MTIKCAWSLLYKNVSSLRRYTSAGTREVYYVRWAAHLGRPKIWWLPYRKLLLPRLHQNNHPDIPASELKIHMWSIVHNYATNPIEISGEISVSNGSQKSNNQSVMTTDSDRLELFSEQLYPQIKKEKNGYPDEEPQNHLFSFLPTFVVDADTLNSRVPQMRFVSSSPPTNYRKTLKSQPTLLKNARGICFA